MKHILDFRLGLAAIVALAAVACTEGPSSVDVPGTDTTQQPAPAPQSPVAPQAASISAVAGEGQSANLGLAVSVAPSVVVRATDGSTMAGVAVTFRVLSGGGSVQNQTSTTNAEGIASAGKWTLGTTPGANTVEASYGALAAVRFSATATNPVLAPAPGSFNIVVRYIGSATARQQSAVASAVAKWQSVVTSDLSNIPLNAPAGSCFPAQPAINETVDDLVIYVQFGNIDGPGKILGQAGPCYVRSDNNLPILGSLQLDSSDLAVMERQGTLDAVVLHEIGHILGIGTLWSTKGVLSGAGTEDPRFVGSQAVSAYHGLGGTDAAIAVENSGGEGTRDGHWRESIFGNELMTGYISAVSNPMSAMTVGSLKDLGYGANLSAASTFTLAPTSGKLVEQVQLHGRELLRLPKFKVDKQGKHTRIQ